MKLAITGKGGVGKTTLTSLLSYLYVEQGRNVLAIDADPSPCLAPALGFPPDLLAGLRPIAEMEELIYERTGAWPGGVVPPERRPAGMTPAGQPGTFGGYFKLNPHVDDLPERFAVKHRGITLLELGAVEKGGSGCICPESVLLKQLVAHILLRRDEVVLLDMYAGVEHLGRATAEAVDAMIVVCEPGARSLATAAQIKALAGDIGLMRLYVVGNKVRSEAERSYIEAHTPGLPVLGHLPYAVEAQEADRAGRAVYDTAPEMVEAAHAIAQALSESPSGL